MIEIDLGKTTTVEIGEHIVIGLDKRYQKLNDGKPLVFSAKIDKNGQLVLLGPHLKMKPSKTGVNFENVTLTIKS